MTADQQEQFSICSLISGGSAEGGGGGLFSRKVEKPKPAYDYTVVPGRKRKAVDETVAGGEVSEKKKKKKQKKELKKEEKENEEAPENADPRRGGMSQVRYEDSKKRQVDAEADKRTLFVGNLPTSVKKKQLVKMFGKYGKVEAVRLVSDHR